ncbi:hypothetical protein MTAT_19840 [Moorella thermoacetica]|uniref:Uncharacterized protein n=1 Tax=Neomoorella thermoacetica TaxID=1525 RepID=A0AAC9HIV0_NEOTH|nr:hypothetical protein [Moorella thermoacetica]AOQ24639.1 hypothetical protein Maut_02211 [Moorella thermoacetica]TYL12742.1 hypothetical protein MTAT_19840 [Moorella thermoacetica]
MTIYELATSLSVAHADLQHKLRVRVGRQFVRANGTKGYLVRVMDIAEDSPTNGFELIGFATVYDGGRIGINGFTELRVYNSDTWEQVVAGPAREIYESNDFEDGMVIRNEVNGLHFTSRLSYSGRSVRNTVRVVDPKSPFFLIGFDVFTGESQRAGVYVAPFVDRFTDIVSVQLPSHLVRAIPLIPSRDEKGGFVKGEDGQTEYVQGEARWFNTVYSATDALAYVALNGLGAAVAEIVEKLLAQNTKAKKSTNKNVKTRKPTTPKGEVHEKEAVNQ